MEDNNKDPQWHEEGYKSPNDEDRFRDGFIDGFVRAREIFWRDFMRRAGECKLMADNAESQSVKDTMSAMEVSYRNAADLVARSHTLYPGALQADASPDDPRFTVKFNEDLYRY